jgi:predicted nucleic acid-binding protein
MPDCPKIIEQAGRGETEIAVSMIAQVEVSYLEGYSDQQSEARIKEFFSRDYIIPVAIDTPLAAIARNLVRKYRDTYRVRPPDAIHLATAIQHHISLIETTDRDLLNLNGLEGSPPITVRRPRYTGPSRLF